MGEMRDEEGGYLPHLTIANSMHIQTLWTMPLFGLPLIAHEPHGKDDGGRTINHQCFQHTRNLLARLNLFLNLFLTQILTLVLALVLVLALALVPEATQQPPTTTTNHSIVLSSPKFHPTRPIDAISKTTRDRR